MSERSARRGLALPGGVLLAGYVLIALLPVAMAYAQGLPARPWRDELSSALALIGFAMLLLEFVVSGRFQTVSGRVGIDLSMRFHQLVALTLTAFLLVHPWLFTLPLEGGMPGDRTRLTSLGLEGPAIGTGWGAWFGLILLVAWARFRSDFGYRYEVWRAFHGLGALAVALLGLHHTLEAGRYSADTRLAAFWFALTGLAVLAMLHIYVVRPLLQRRHPYRVVSVRRVALRTWEVVVEPARGEAMVFEAGQFVWLTLNRSPFSITEHPFSMSSCPADRPRVSFTIKEMGDATSAIGDLPPGAPAFLDGPHGNLVVGGHCAHGLVLIAGGVGLAPVLSILRQAQADGQSVPIRLIYGNRVAEQIMYPEELQRLSAEMDLEIVHVLSEPPEGWTGEVGLIDSALLRRCLPGANASRWLYMVCGPSPMIDAVEQSLAELDIPLRQIVSEKFSYD